MSRPTKGNNIYLSTSPEELSVWSEEIVFVTVACATMPVAVCGYNATAGRPAHLLCVLIQLNLRRSFLSSELEI